MMTFFLLLMPIISYQEEKQIFLTRFDTFEVSLKNFRDKHGGNPIKESLS